jgi:hypothetical protein
VPSLLQTRELSVRFSGAEHSFEQEETWGSRDVEDGDDTRRRTVEGESEQEKQSFVGSGRQNDMKVVVGRNRTRTGGGPTLLESGSDSRRSSHEINHVGCSAAFMKSFDHATRQGTKSFRNSGKLRDEENATDSDHSDRREGGEDVFSERSSHSSATSSTEEKIAQLPSTEMQGIHCMSSTSAFRQIEFDLAVLMHKLKG